MTDSRLQQLKRAWEASGSVEDRVALLHERLRSGALSQRGLHLLAYVGDKGAEQLFEGDCCDVTALLHGNVIAFAAGDPQEELLHVLRGTLGKLRDQLTEQVESLLALEGYECEGVGPPRSAKDDVRLLADNGVHVPMVLAEWSAVVGPVSLVGYVYHRGPDAGGRITTLVESDPLEVKWSAEYALLENTPEDDEDEWEESGLGFTIPFAPDPGHKMNVSSSGAYNLLCGSVPCLDALVYDDDSGFKGTLLTHVRQAVRNGGFLDLPDGFELKRPREPDPSEPTNPS